jgi:hypothetical protein
MGMSSTAIVHYVDDIASRRCSRSYDIARPCAFPALCVRVKYLAVVCMRVARTRWEENGEDESVPACSAVVSREVYVPRFGFLHAPPPQPQCASSDQTTRASCSGDTFNTTITSATSHLQPPLLHIRPHTIQYGNHVRLRLLLDAPQRLGKSSPTAAVAGTSSLQLLPLRVLTALLVSTRRRLGQERTLQRRLAHQHRPLLSRFPARPPSRLVRDPAEPRSLRRIPASACRRRARRRTNHILRYLA